MCTEHHMTKLIKKLQEVDIVNQCTRERVNTKWISQTYKVIVFALLLTILAIVGEETVLFKQVLRDHNMDCLTCQNKTRQLYNDNL